MNGSFMISGYHDSKKHTMSGSFFAGNSHFKHEQKEKTPEKCISGPAGGENGAPLKGPPIFTPHPPPLFRASFYPPKTENCCLERVN
jgi:hypothetical protein